MAGVGTPTAEPLCCRSAQPLPVRLWWPGSIVRARTLAEDEVCTVGGLPTTTPEVTVLDLARWRGLRPAVLGLDCALAQRQTDTRRVRRALARRAGHPGVRTAQQTLALASGLRQSPLESEFRCMVHDARLPAPVDQYVVTVGGERVGRVDFAWPEAMVVVELDGFAFHREYGPFQDDRRRDRRMSLAGWLVLRFTAADLRERGDDVMTEVRAALEDRGVLA